MTEVVLFHHALGLTEGVTSFADALRAAGHDVHTPDLFAGRTFATLEEGVAHAEEIGFPTVVQRGVAAVEGLPAEVVLIGWSLGVLPAQHLAQTRPGCLGAVLVYSCVPPDQLAEPPHDVWPSGVPVQVHGMDADPVFVGEGDLEAARVVVAAAERGELFLYPGDQHYFADPTLPSYDAGAAALLLRRTLALLGSVG